MGKMIPALHFVDLNMQWFLFSLAGIGVLLLAVFLVTYFFNIHYFYQQFEKIWEALGKIDKSQKYDQELFDDHFKVTNETILEERREKSFWKKKALALEKKHVKLKK